MNKKEIIELIAKSTHLEKNKVGICINTMLDIMTEALDRNETVILNRFGTFKKVLRAERTGRNPHTNQPVKIPPTYSVVFKCSNNLKEVVSTENKSRSVDRSNQVCLFD